MGSFAIPGHNILPSGKHSPCPSRCGLPGTAAAPEVEPPEFMGEALLPRRTERRTVRRRIKFSNRRRSAESWSIRCSCCLNSSLVGPFWLEEDPHELLQRGLLLRPREVLERLVDRWDRRAPLLEREVLGAGLFSSSMKPANLNKLLGHHSQPMIWHFFRKQNLTLNN